MNEINHALLSLALAIPLSILWMAFMYRIRKGNYKVIGSTKTATLFKTSIGEFRLDGGHDKLQVNNGKDGWVGYDTNTIRELSFRQSEEPAWFAEFITGFNLWDLSGRYRDQNILFKIDAVSNSKAWCKSLSDSRKPIRDSGELCLITPYTPDHSPTLFNSSTLSAR